MFKDRKNVLTLTAVIFAAIAFYTALNHLQAVLNAFNIMLNWFTPVISGFAIAFFLNVFVRFIEEVVLKKFKGKKWLRAVSIVASILIIFLVITMVSVFIAPEIKRTLVMLAKTLPVYVNNIMEQADNIKLPVLDMTLGSILELKEFDSFANYLTKQILPVMSNALNITTTFAGKVFDGVLSFIIAIYVLAYKEKLAKLSKRCVNAFLPQARAKTVLEIAALSHNTFYNFITGQLTEAVILGTLCYLGMLICRFPYGAAISMLIGITALIPIVGAFIGIVVGAFLIVMVSPLKAVLFVVFVLVLQQVEGNLIYPKVVGKSVGLPDILVIIAVLVGGRIGGIGAVLLSVPVCSILYSIFKTHLKTLEENKLESKG